MTTSLRSSGRASSLLDHTSCIRDPQFYVDPTCACGRDLVDVYDHLGEREWICADPECDPSGFELLLGDAILALDLEIGRSETACGRVCVDSPIVRGDTFTAEYFLEIAPHRHDLIDLPGDAIAQRLWDFAADLAPVVRALPTSDRRRADGSRALEVTLTHALTPSSVEFAFDWGVR